MPHQQGTEMLQPALAAESAGSRELRRCLEDLNRRRAEHRAEAEKAPEALDKLIECMRHRTGQGYKLRALLFSMWNGKPASVCDVLHLDWDLRQAFAQVLLGFGYEERGGVRFFYDAILERIRKAGLEEWFRAQGEDEEV